MSIDVTAGFNVLVVEPVDSREVFPTLAEAKQLATNRRYQGLKIFIEDEAALYWFQNGVTDADLVPFPTGGGGTIPTPVAPDETALLGDYSDAKLTYDALTTKVDKQQAVEDAGKVLGIGVDGIVVPVVDAGATAPVAPDETALLGDYSDAKLTYDALTTKVDKQQAVEDAGKVLGIGADGIVVPVVDAGGDLPAPVAPDETALLGDYSDAKLTYDALSARVDKQQAVEDSGKVLGIGADGIVAPVANFAGLEQGHNISLTTNSSNGKTIVAAADANWAATEGSNGYIWNKPSIPNISNLANQDLSNLSDEGEEHFQEKIWWGYGLHHERGAEFLDVWTSPPDWEAGSNDDGYILNKPVLDDDYATITFDNIADIAKHTFAPPIMSGDNIYFTNEKNEYNRDAKKIHAKDAVAPDASAKSQDYTDAKATYDALEGRAKTDLTNLTSIGEAHFDPRFERTLKEGANITLDRTTEPGKTIISSSGGGDGGPWADQDLSNLSADKGEKHFSKPLTEGQNITLSSSNGNVVVSAAYANWDAAAGADGYIQNKPEIPDTSNFADKDLETLSDIGEAHFQKPLEEGTNIAIEGVTINAAYADWIAAEDTTGYIKNKPTIPNGDEYAKTDFSNITTAAKDYFQKPLTPGANIEIIEDPDDPKKQLISASTPDVSGYAYTNLGNLTTEGEGNGESHFDYRYSPPISEGDGISIATADDGHKIISSTVKTSGPGIGLAWDQYQPTLMNVKVDGSSIGFDNQQRLTLNATVVTSFQDRTNDNDQVIGWRALNNKGGQVYAHTDAGTIGPNPIGVYVRSIQSGSGDITFIEESENGEYGKIIPEFEWDSDTHRLIFHTDTLNTAWILKTVDNIYDAIPSDLRIALIAGIEAAIAGATAAASAIVAANNYSTSLFSALQAQITTLVTVSAQHTTAIANLQVTSANHTVDIAQLSSNRVMTSYAGATMALDSYGPHSLVNPILTSSSGLLINMSNWDQASFANCVSQVLGTGDGLQFQNNVLSVKIDPNTLFFDQANGGRITVSQGVDFNTRGIALAGPNNSVRHITMRAWFDGASYAAESLATQSLLNQAIQPYEIFLNQRLVAVWPDGSEDEWIIPFTDFFSDNDNYSDPGSAFITYNWIIRTFANAGALGFTSKAHYTVKVDGVSILIDADANCLKLAYDFTNRWVVYWDVISRSYEQCTFHQYMTDEKYHYDALITQGFFAQAVPHVGAGLISIQDPQSKKTTFLVNIGPGLAFFNAGGDTDQVRVNCGNGLDVDGNKLVVKPNMTLTFQQVGVDNCLSVNYNAQTSGLNATATRGLFVNIGRGLQILPVAQNSLLEPKVDFSLGYDLHGQLGVHLLQNSGLAFQDTPNDYFNSGLFVTVDNETIDRDDDGLLRCIIADHINVFTADNTTPEKPLSALIVPEDPEPDDHYERLVTYEYLQQVGGFVKTDLTNLRILHPLAIANLSQGNTLGVRIVQTTGLYVMPASMGESGGIAINLPDDPRSTLGVNANNQLVVKRSDMGALRAMAGSDDTHGGLGVRVDNTSIRINTNNELEVTVQGGGSYHAGFGLQLQNDTFTADIDSHAGLYFNGQSIAVKVADGIELDAQGYIKAKIDNSTIKLNGTGQLVAYAAVPNLTGGDGIDITNDTISVKCWSTGIDSDFMFDNGVLGLRSHFIPGGGILFSRYQSNDREMAISIHPDDSSIYIDQTISPTPPIRVRFNPAKGLAIGGTPATGYTGLEIKIADDLDFDNSGNLTLAYEQFDFELVFVATEITASDIVIKRIDEIYQNTGSDWKSILVSLSTLRNYYRAGPGLEIFNTQGVPGLGFRVRYGQGLKYSGTSELSSLMLNIGDGLAFEEGKLVSALQEVEEPLFIEDGVINIAFSDAFTIDDDDDDFPYVVDLAFSDESLFQDEDGIGVQLVDKGGLELIDTENDSGLKVKLGDGLSFDSNGAIYTNFLEGDAIRFDIDEDTHEVKVNVRFSPAKGLMIKNDYLNVHLGDGLAFDNNGAIYTNYVQGDGIQFDIDSDTGTVEVYASISPLGLEFHNGNIAVKLAEKGGLMFGAGGILQANIGAGLQFDDNGAIEVVTPGGIYTGGQGVVISDADVISLNIGTGLQFNGNILEATSHDCPCHGGVAIEVTNDHAINFLYDIKSFGITNNQLHVNAAPGGSLGLGDNGLYLRFNQSTGLEYTASGIGIKAGDGLKAEGSTLQVKFDDTLEIMEGGFLSVTNPSKPLWTDHPIHFYDYTDADDVEYYGLEFLFNPQHFALDNPQSGQFQLNFNLNAGLEIDGDNGLSVNIGNGLQFNNGAIEVVGGGNYTGGDGIDLINNVISARIGPGFKFGIVNLDDTGQSLLLNVNDTQFGFNDQGLLNLKRVPLNLSEPLYDYTPQYPTPTIHLRLANEGGLYKKTLPDDPGLAINYDIATMGINDDNALFARLPDYAFIDGLLESSGVVSVLPAIYRGITVEEDGVGISIGLKGIGLQFDPSGALMIKHGKGLDIDLDTGNLIVKSGNGLMFNTNGVLYVAIGNGLQFNNGVIEVVGGGNYTGGPGIVIDGNEIKANIDENGYIGCDKQGHLNWQGPLVYHPAQDGFTTSADEIRLNIGDGLAFNEQHQLVATGGGGGLDYSAGDGIAISIEQAISVSLANQSGLKFVGGMMLADFGAGLEFSGNSIQAKLGSGLNFDNNGNIVATGQSFSAGCGIDIDPSNVLSLKIDPNSPLGCYGGFLTFNFVAAGLQVKTTEQGVPYLITKIDEDTMLYMTGGAISARQYLSGAAIDVDDNRYISAKVDDLTIKINSDNQIGLEYLGRDFEIEPNKGLRLHRDFVDDGNCIKWTRDANFGTPRWPNLVFGGPLCITKNNLNEDQLDVKIDTDSGIQYGQFGLGLRIDNTLGFRDSGPFKGALYVANQGGFQGGPGITIDNVTISVTLNPLECPIYYNATDTGLDLALSSGLCLVREGNSSYVAIARGHGLGFAAPDADDIKNLQLMLGPGLEFGAADQQGIKCFQPHLGDGLEFSSVNLDAQIRVKIGTGLKFNAGALEATSQMPAIESPLFIENNTLKLLFGVAFVIHHPEGSNPIIDLDISDHSLFTDEDGVRVKLSPYGGLGLFNDGEGGLKVNIAKGLEFHNTDDTSSIQVKADPQSIVLGDFGVGVKVNTARGLLKEDAGIGINFYGRDLNIKNVGSGPQLTLGEQFVENAPAITWAKDSFGIPRQPILQFTSDFGISSNKLALTVKPVNAEQIWVLEDIFINNGRTIETIDKIYQQQVTDLTKVLVSVSTLQKYFYAGPGLENYLETSVAPGIGFRVRCGQGLQYTDLSKTSSLSLKVGVQGFQFQNGYLNLLIGNGLAFQGNALVATGSNYTGGDGVTINDREITLDIGDGLAFNEQHQLVATGGGGGTYTGGNGIYISEDLVIDVVLSQESGLQFAAGYLQILTGAGLYINENGYLTINPGNGLEFSETYELQLNLGNGLEFGSIEEDCPIQVRLGAGLQFNNGVIETTGDGGATYTDGDGILIDDDNEISAALSSIGGLKFDSGYIALNVDPEGGLVLADFGLGVRLHNGGGLRFNQGELEVNFGGDFESQGINNPPIQVKLGDGLEHSQFGVKAKIGTGLQFNDGAIEATAATYTDGDGILIDDENEISVAINPLKGLEFDDGAIAINIGAGLQFNADTHALEVTGGGGNYTNGPGIIIDGNEIKANIDEESYIGCDKQGHLNWQGPQIFYPGQDGLTTSGDEIRLDIGDGLAFNEQHQLVATGQGPTYTGEEPIYINDNNVIGLQYDSTLQIQNNLLHVTGHAVEYFDGPGIGFTEINEDDNQISIHTTAPAENVWVAWDNGGVQHRDNLTTCVAPTKVAALNWQVLVTIDQAQAMVHEALTQFAAANGLQYNGTNWPPYTGA